jgi:hypothetical protein
MTSRPSRKRSTRKGREAWGLRNMQRGSTTIMSAISRRRRLRHKKSKGNMLTTILKILKTSKKFVTYYVSYKLKNNSKKKHCRMQIKEPRKS